ncbi:MAG: hypothetical protein NT172_06740 [Planctomycetota bacterium]|nr:hypothetical protein [Planctomycetota bacterium]
MSYDQDFDPYAQPKSGTPSQNRSELTGSRDFAISDVLERSWQILRSQMGLVISAFFALFFISFGFQFIAGLMAKKDAINPMMVLLNFAGGIVSLYITCGFFTFLLNLASGRKASLNDLFKGGPILIKAFLGGILMSIAFGVTIGIFIALGLILFNNTGGAAEIFVLIIVGVFAFTFIATRYSQYLYLLVDREVGVMESFNLSSKLMKGRFWQYNIMLMVFGLINLSGLIPFGLGLIVTIPLTSIATAVYYLAITGQPIYDPMAIASKPPEEFV